MSEERRTLKEICEAYVKWKGLNISAKEFYELSPTGELSHVFDALEEMKAAGHEIPRLEKEIEK